MTQVKIFLFFSMMLLGSIPVMAQTVSLDKKIASILKKYQIPGAAITLVDKDTVLYTGYFGKSDLVGNRTVGGATKFTIGSISKTFLALGILSAQEKGQLSISSPLREMSPGFNFTNQYSQGPLTLAHLLEHTSGFDEAHFDIFARTDANTPFQSVLGQSQHALTTRWAPGSYFSYNTLNYIAAAAILEEKVDGDFVGFMRENILEPLGMHDATFHPEANPDWSKAYSSAYEEPFPSLPQWPAGSLTTNLKGMQNFTQLFLNKGSFNGNQLVSSTSIQAMETPETSLLARNGVKFGYGKGLMQEFVGNTVFYGHNGSYGGFLSGFGYSRDLNIGYVILINDREGSKAIKEIKNELLKPYRSDPIPASEAAHSPPQKFEGAYQPITFNVEVLYPFMRLIDLQLLDAEGEHLVQSSMMGGAVRWAAVEERKFQKDNEPQASTVFIEENMDTLWLGETSYIRISKVSAYVQFYLALLCIALLVFSFFSLGITCIRAGILKGKVNRAVLFSFLACMFLVVSFTGLVFFYDPEKLYSTGAMVYYFSSWLFLVFSVISGYFFVHGLFVKPSLGKWLWFQVRIASVVNLIISSYLMYWGLIGLALWNY